MNDYRLNYGQHSVLHVILHDLTPHKIVLCHFGGDFFGFIYCKVSIYCGEQHLGKAVQNSQA